MCGGIHYEEVEGLVSVENWSFNEVLSVWWIKYMCCLRTKWTVN